MQAALENLRTDAKSKIKVTTTHLYVKFIPLSSDELDILARDSTLTLFERPLDYEVLQSGHFYREPGIPADQPTPLYCAVPSDYIFPSCIVSQGY